MTKAADGGVTLRSQRKAQRRRDLLDAAIHLFSTRGYHEVSVQDIADEAGVSIGLLYKYARSKQELLFLSLMAVNQRSAECVPALLAGSGTPLERLKAGFAGYCSVMDENKHQVVMAYTETRRLETQLRQTVRDDERRVHRWFVEAIEAGVDSGQFRATVDCDLAAHNLRVLAHQWALKNASLSRRFSLQEFVRLEFEFFAEGILAPASVVARRPPVDGTRRAWTDASMESRSDS